MDKKLTLSVDKSIIEKAKRYAKQNKTSLSKLVETYFGKLINEEGQSDDSITPLVKSLSGVIDLPKDFDYKKREASIFKESINEFIFD